MGQMVLLNTFTWGSRIEVYREMEYGDTGFAILLWVHCIGGFCGIFGFRSFFSGLGFVGFWVQGVFVGICLEGFCGIWGSRSGV